MTALMTNKSNHAHTHTHTPTHVTDLDIRAGGDVARLQVQSGEKKTVGRKRRRTILGSRRRAATTDGAGRHECPRSWINAAGSVPACLNDQLLDDVRFEPSFDRASSECSAPCTGLVETFVVQVHVDVHQ